MNTTIFWSMLLSQINQSSLGTHYFLEIKCVWLTRQINSRIVFILLWPLWIVLRTILNSDNKRLFVVLLISIVVISSILPLGSYDLVSAKSKKKVRESSDTPDISSKDVTNEDNTSSQQPNIDNGISDQPP